MVVDDQATAGFAYGTLPGHPESGEEAFIVTFHHDGDVTLSITAFSQPARWYSRIGGPVTRLIQHVVTNRYLAALDMTQ